MINVYAWPPVGARGTEWTEVAPVQESRSIITGADYTSAAQRIRRMVTLSVSGLRGGDHAGYMEVLKRYLAGIHAVRLYSAPINKHLAAARRDVLLFSEATLTGTTGTDAGGWPVITVSGLPVSSLIARPGEFLTAFVDSEDLVGVTVQIANPAVSNGSGVAVVRLFEPLPALTGVGVRVGASDTGVFKPVRYPRAVQPVQGDWTYDWEFREIFEDEVGAGGFVEVNPWS
ncbi:hypothetical protein [Puniceibacterium confluentis]|uniref:hypothetical protein n=1 Tax=Puniceibacterium confluentis TaxID=1958944 RepID=UPI0011B37AD6|nr:hypothetical protein [Puniceibacterium confluentis]